jgi:hypothetical protein
MKKSIVILITFIITIIPNSILLNREIFEVNNDFLLQTKFYHPNRTFRIVEVGGLFPAKYSTGESASSEISFGNNNYYLNFSEECGAWYTNGTFKIKNGKVFLYPTECNNHGEDVKCNKSFFGEGTCYIEDDKNDLLYSKYFICKPLKSEIFTCNDYDNVNEYFKFPIFKTRIKPGSKKYINNILVITLGQMKGIIIQEAILKKNPNIDSPSIDFIPSFKIESHKSVPINEEILLIARTEKKDKIDISNNYWYYINIGFNEGVWVFGDSIKIIDK